MNVKPEIDSKSAAPILLKADQTTPALAIAADGAGIIIKAGTTFQGRSFDGREVIPFPESSRVPGSDYAVALLKGGGAEIVRLTSADLGSDMLGGFHYAPGGNASARAGGDTVPVINTYSLHDLNFRPACPDPRGMALIEQTHGRKFWCDIYLLGVDHVANGTSKFGVTIADGNERPINPATGKPFKKLDYETAVAVMAHHGKQLLSFEEFADAMIGVTEKTSIGSDPEVTKLDALRTSRFGIMQATGNMYVWGHDGDPDEPRASIFGGSWWGGGNAGSRRANLDYWSDNSNDNIGARGRSDDRFPARHRSRPRRPITCSLALARMPQGASARDQGLWSARVSCFGEYTARSGIAGRRRHRRSRPAAGFSVEGI